MRHVLRLAAGLSLLIVIVGFVLLAIVVVSAIIAAGPTVFATAVTCVVCLIAYTLGMIFVE